MNTQWGKENKPYKSIMREFATDRDAAASVYLTLPAEELLDIKLALKKGTITPSTYVIAVEKEWTKHAQIEKYLKSHFDNYYLHRGELVTLPAANLRKTPVELAYIDLCGSITPQFIVWLSSFQGTEFAPNADISWTFNLTLRNSIFFGKFSDVVRDEGFLWTGTDESRQFARIMEKCPLTYITPDWFQAGPEYKQLFVLYTFYAALTQFKFEFMHIQEYKDYVVKMLFIKTKILGPSSTKNIAYAPVIEIVNNMLDSYTIEDIHDRNTSQTDEEAPSGIRPPGLSGPQWAWHVNNPNGIRNKKKTKVVSKSARPAELSPAIWAWHPDNPNGRRNKK